MFAALSWNHPIASLVERSGMVESDRCRNAQREIRKGNERLFKNGNEQTTAATHWSFRGNRGCRGSILEFMANLFDASLHAVPCFFDNVSGSFRGFLDARPGPMDYVFGRLRSYVACVFCRFVDGGCDVLGNRRGSDRKGLPQGRRLREASWCCSPLFQCKMLGTSDSTFAGPTCSQDLEADLERCLNPLMALHSGFQRRSESMDTSIR